MLRKSFVAISALALVSTPVVAQSIDRSAAPVSEGEQFGGENAVLLGVAVLAAWAAAVYFIVENDDEDVDLPTSP